MIYLYVRGRKAETLRLSNETRSYASCHHEGLGLNRPLLLLS